MATPEKETLDSPNQNDVNPMPAEAVRWRCDPSALPFGSTKDVEPMVGVVGHDDPAGAWVALLASVLGGTHLFGRVRRTGHPFLTVRGYPFAVPPGVPVI